MLPVTKKTLVHIEFKNECALFLKAFNPKRQTHFSWPNFPQPQNLSPFSSISFWSFLGQGGKGLLSMC